MLEWTHTLLCTGAACAVLLYLCPDGRIHGMMETGCACVMLLALVSPLSRLDIDAYAEMLSEYRHQIEGQEQQTILTVQQVNQHVMKREYEAYIINEAALHNFSVISVDVEISESEGGYWIPYAVSYITEQEIPASFLQFVETQLGIPVERQSIHATITENTYEFDQ